MVRKKRKRRLVLKKEKKLNRLIFVGCIICIITIFNLISSKISNNKTEPTISKNISSSKNIDEDKNQTSKVPKKNTKDNILLTCIGDCTLGRDDKYSYSGSLPDILKQRGNDYSYVFKNVVSIFNSDDITTANFEGTLTDSKTKANKKFTFKAPADYANILTSGNIEGVNLSNNHTMDYLQKGFEDTKTALSNKKINYFGENNVWTTTVKGVKLGFLGYRGFNKNEDLLNKIKSDIKKLKDDNNLVIINFHWGEEGQYKPNNTQKEIAHFAIDNGADLIIGHHPHVLQGIEKYNNKLIFYSLGNFAFGGNKNPRDKDTMIVQIKFHIENGSLVSYDFKIIPCKLSSVNYTNDYCPTPATGFTATKILNKINNLSFNLDSDINGEFHNITYK